MANQITPVGKIKNKKHEMTYHIFADFDGVFEDGPDYYFIACGGSQGPQVAIVA